MIEYHPISVEAHSRLHQVGPKVLSRIFLGYALYAREIWKGDIMVADIEALEEVDASELHAWRLNAKEVLTPQRSGNFIFPVADGTVIVSGEDQDLRASNLIRDSPDRAQEQNNLRGESDGSPSILRQDSSWSDGEAKSDFQFLSCNSTYCHHVDSRVKLCMSRKESWLFCWSTSSTLPEQHIRHRMYCRRNLLRITGKLMEKENYGIHGQVSRGSLYQVRGHLMEMDGLGWDQRSNTRLQDPTMNGQICGSLSLMHRNARKGNIRSSRSQSVSWKMLVKSWKFGCQQQCLVDFNWISPRETCGKVRQHETKYACIVEADEFSRIRMEDLWRHNTGRGPNSLSHCNIVH